MNDGFEATFSISVDRATAWERLVTKLPWLPGWGANFRDIDLDEGIGLVAVKDEEPCRNTQVVVRLEDADAGTVIHIVQSGFGAGFDRMHDTLQLGWDLIVADVKHVLATGEESHGFHAMLMSSD